MAENQYIYREDIFLLDGEAVAACSAARAPYAASPEG
jgi:hypothetical protein